MNKFTLFLICIFCATSLWGQINFPQRKTFSFVSGSSSYIQNWNPAVDSEDHWYQSQIPLKDRFVFTASQANPSLSNEKEYLLWAIASKNPHGSDEIGWAINQMEYRDMYCLWVGGGGQLEIPPASRIESCHRQGVKVTANITFADGVRPGHARWTDWLGMFEKDAQGNYIHAQKVAEICKHYGVDGLSLNWEVNSMTSTMDVTISDGKEWIRQVRTAAANIGMPDFTVVFYHVWYNSGARSFGIGEVDANSDAFFGSSSDVISDYPFINYVWNSYDIDATANHCNSIGRDSRDVMFGVSFYGDRSYPFGKIATSNAGLGFWGEPYQSVNLPQNTTLEKEIYFNKQAELFMSGPTNDPSDASISASAYGTHPGTWGIAAMRPAKSAIQTLPWHTIFCTGNGEGFNYMGQQIHDKYWNNESIQTDLPTWKWWWETGGTGLSSYLDYYTSYTGATSVKINGNIQSGDNILRLFKTKLLVDNTTKIYLTYKVDDLNANVESHLELALAFENGNNVSSYTKLPIGATTKAGWNTKEIDLSSFAGQTIAVISANITGEVNGYNLNLGAISITNDHVVSPPSPINLNASELNTANNQIDVKLTWELPNNPRYNEDVGVNHFEIYQVNGDTGEKKLMGLSRARGIILNDIPSMPNNPNLQFEIVSVANDNITKSIDTGTPPDPEPELKNITLETGTCMANSTWQTISLDSTYTSMVVVATPVLNSLSEIPGVVRIKNVTTNSFDIKLQSGSNSTIVSARKVYFMAIEEGVYNVNDHGVKMEVVKASTVNTAYKWHFNVDLRAYNNTYLNPVIVGQVMTENDVDFSHFWISSGTQAPITNSSFNAGLIVDEHSDVDRVSETIGYVILESGVGKINERNYVAQQASGITGLENTPTGHTISLPTNNLDGNLYGFATINGMAGSNGGWANLYSNTPLAQTSISLTLDEDQFSDTERKHISEPTCFLIIDESVEQTTAAAATLKSFATDIDQTKQISKIETSIYPNPTSGLLYIDNADKNSIYQICSLTGSIVKKGKLLSNSINVGELSKGVYWIIITCENEIVKHKFVKN